MVKLFKHIREEIEEKPWRLRLMPAIRHESGKLHIGKRGMDHSEIRLNHPDEEGKPLKGEAGFYDPREKKFLTRDEAGGIDSTRTLTPKEADERRERRQSEARAKREREEKLDTTDTMSDVQRMRKYGTIEENNDPMISFRSKADSKRLVPSRSGSKGGDAGGGDGSLEEASIKQRIDPKCWTGRHKEGTKIKGGIRVNNCVPNNESLNEGNPLSRMVMKPRHSISMSAERKGLIDKENNARMKDLHTKLREHGLSFRRTKGKWDEGGGVGTENSVQVYPKGSSKEDIAHLLHTTKKLARAFDQDAILHRSPKGTGTAIYTSDTSSNKKGDKVTYGKTSYNTPNPYGETEFKATKPEKNRPRFTFK